MDRDDFAELAAAVGAACPEVGGRVYRLEDLQRESDIAMVQQGTLQFPMCVVAVASWEPDDDAPMDVEAWRVDVRVSYVAEIGDPAARTDPADPYTSDPQGLVAGAARRIALRLLRQRGPRLYGQRCRAAPNLGAASALNDGLSRLLDGRVASTVSARVLTGRIPDWKIPA